MCECSLTFWWKACPLSALVVNKCHRKESFFSSAFSVPVNVSWWAVSLSSLTTSSPDRRLMTLLFPSFRQLQLRWSTPSFHTLTLPLCLPGPNHCCLKRLNPLHSPVNEPFKKSHKTPTISVPSSHPGWLISDKEIIRVPEGEWDVLPCMTHHQTPMGETHTVPVTGVTSNGCKWHLWLRRAAAPWGWDLFISAHGQSVMTDLDREQGTVLGPATLWERDACSIERFRTNDESLKVWWTNQ